MSPEDFNHSEQERFRITPKSSNRLLTSYERSSSNFKKAVARDMVLNAEELGGEDLNFILDHIHIQVGSTSVKGISAIEFSVGATVGSFASRTGKHMHSPEIVYMSGYYFYKVLDRRFQKLNPQVELGRQGERKFGTKEQKKEQLDKEEHELKKVVAFKDRLRASLTQFAEQKGLSDPKYLEILRRLIFMRGSDNQKERDKIIDLLKTGNIAGAYEILKEVNIKDVLAERI